MFVNNGVIAGMREQLMELIIAVGVVRGGVGSQYIYLKPITIRNKSAWAVVNRRSGVEIACIAWYKSWRNYTITDTPAVFDVGCMKTIIEGIKL